jgi:ribosomal 50S subunit-recycling heat shock protein
VYNISGDIMRLDKYLKVSRIIKRRTVSHDLASADRVLVNDKLAKPGLKLKIGDIIELTLGNKVITFKVLNLNEYANKSNASEMYEIISEIDKE